MRSTRGTVAYAVLLSAAVAAAGGLEITTDTFGALRARPIGPAVMSGRISAVDAVHGPPLEIWVGSASGGVWRSTDGGVSFAPVFDESTQSIGAIAIDPQDPRTVWVGTGESWVRNSVSVGDGVYRTTDGGETWEHLGLEDTERIARIVIHPDDGDTVYVCAPGHLWDPDPERGVFRTTDGGTSWEKVLFIDEDTGCSDLAIDPQEPAILYAGMWQFRRRPDFFTSGGPGSGLYRSTDGGATWHVLTRGLPEGEKGRIAVAVAPSRPSRVYAVVEARETALYRSDDLGATWEKVNTSFDVRARPFYFATLAVDPDDHDTVYKPGFSLAISTDGGESFTSPFLGGGGDVHPDHHCLWIDPEDPNVLVLGTDGGLYISRDRGHRFQPVRSLPVSQFYHVAVDGAFPYNVYGGLQDNGSWMGPSRAPGGITNRDWTNIGYGDGFWAFPDPADPDVLYVEYQGGRVLRVRRSLGEIKEIAPYEREGEEELRFNWNAPIHLSPSRPGTIYLGAQYLFRSTDRGESWERISPDLTTDDPRRQRQERSGGLTIDNSTAENNATIYTIAASPLDPEVIWVGTDDGYVQVTEDGGGSWRNVTAAIPGVPEGTWVSRVHASPHDRATAFVTFDGHRTGDMATYLYRTTDLGRSWQRLPTEGVEGYAWVMLQDPVRASLLFLGTEHGLWVSLDGGVHWARFEGGLPRKVAVRDLVIHPTEGDLVIATHGRGVWILDDLSPLRALSAEVLESEVALLPSRPARMVTPARVQGWTGDDEFVGENPPDTAVIAYWQRRRHLFGDLRVEIHDARGERIATIPGSKRMGINRVEWPMRLEPPKVPPASSLIPAFLGPRVPEGTYTVRLVKGSTVLEGKVTVAPDPRSPHSAEDRRLQQETALALYHDLGELTFLIDSVVALGDAARERAGAAPRRLARRLDAYADELEAFRASLVATGEGGMLSGEEKLREKLGELYGAVSGYDGRPTDSQLARKEQLAGELQAARARFAELTGRPLAGLNRRLARLGLPPLEPLTRQAWKERQRRTGAGAVLSGRAAAEAMGRLGLALAGL